LDELALEASSNNLIFHASREGMRAPMPLNEACDVDSVTRVSRQVSVDELMNSARYVNRADEEGELMRSSYREDQLALGTM
jgi:hypothetical protein